MGNSRPVKVKCWRAFLKSRGCNEVHGTRHEKWRCPGCIRSIMFRGAEKDIPFPHIKSNLDSMGFSVDKFWEWEAKNC